MAESFINNYNVTVGVGGIDSSSTSLPVTVAASIASGFRILVGTELMIVTGGGTTLTWTVSRAAENTIAAAHSFGDVVNIVLTAGGLQNLLNINGLWGALVQNSIGSGLSISTLANVSSGNLMIVTCNYESGSSTPTCADSKSTVYTRVCTVKPNIATCAVFWGVVGGSGANTITVTSATAGFSSISYTELLPLWSSVSSFTATANVSNISVTAPATSLIFSVCAGEFYNHAAITPYAPLQLLSSWVVNGVADPMSTAFITNPTSFSKTILCNYNTQADGHPGVTAVIFQ